MAKPLIGYRRCCLLLLVILHAIAVSAHAEVAPLTSVVKIRELSRDESAKALPVKLRGVVIWQDSGLRPSFFLHDGEKSIWIGTPVATSRGIWQGGEPPLGDSKVGALVEVEGVTDTGGYAPCVLPIRFTRVGSARVPVAQRLPLERLLSGSEDGQRVEVDGVVQAVDPPDYFGDSKVMLKMDGHLCRVVSEHGEELDPAQLVDARVRVRGILVPLPNIRSQVAGLRMNVMGAGDFQILKPPPADPFLANKVSLNRLLPFSPDARLFHRTVAQGVVTMAVRDQFFFLQEGLSSVRVQANPADVRPGDRVEVAGFIDDSRVLASLTGAIYRHLGKAAVPPPVNVSVERILHPDFRNDFEKVSDKDFSGRRVRFNGQLIRIERREVGAPPSLLIAAEGSVFSAYLTERHPSLPVNWVEGAHLDLTGVCELDFKEDSSTQSSISIEGFRLWIASPGDVRVISVPSWWTPQRLGIALSSVVAVLVLAILWNFALQRLLLKRSNMLEAVMREHRDSELEFEGAKQERRRLASDLHDGLQQLIAGAAYRMEAAIAHLGDIPPVVGDQFIAAKRALLRSQVGLRDALWGLQHMEEDSDDFVALLRHAVGSVEQWPVDAVQVGFYGKPYTVSRQAMGSLLLLMQETVGNAFKHGGANHVEVTLRYGLETLEFQINDDGCGFEPNKAPGPKEGHFGLESARLRMKWLGGTVEFQSAPGQGTNVICRIPRGIALAPEAAKTHLS